MSQANELAPSHLTGLSQEEVLRQQKLGLVNTIPDKITKTNTQIIKDNLFTLFNFYNFVIAFCLLAVGAYSNMLFILIIIINILIGIAQEIHAKNLVEELSLVTIPRALVVRDSNTKEISVEEIVLSDILVFESGRQIAVDSKVVSGEVEVNESLLTGEADSITKRSGDTLLSGSFVVSGRCRAQAQHIGIDNYAAKIAHEAKQHKAVSSELLRSMRKVTQFTSFLIIPLGAILFAQAFFWRGDTLQPAVVATAAGLLGMLPKGLVLLISIALASGVIMLSRKKVLVQELFALETLAHVDVLCLDKTGTITEGKMSVQSVHILQDASLPDGFTKVIGCFLRNADDNNATFFALQEHFSECGDFTPEHKIAFSSQRKWSAMSFVEGFSLVLGAPERLSEQPLPEKVAQQEREGSRILLATYSKGKIGEDNKLPELIPWAYITINDPVRENAPETLAYFKEEGVEIKIVSGDNPLTVSIISKAAGLEKYYSYVDMSDFTTDEQIDAAASEYTVFGRVSPYQKKRIIQALKKNGHTVAMTGDGVNDVLALREADCSIALAEGSDAARQVSKLVLLNSDFGAMLSVLDEGRRVVNNVTRIASIFFVKTIYSVLLTMLCVCFNVPFPFIPLQIALIDVTIEGYPSFFMSFEKDNRKVTEPFLHTVFRRALPNSLTIIIIMLTVSFIATQKGLLPGDQITVTYMLIGFISILALVRACTPFNKLRLFLCSTTIVGFFGCALLFNGFFRLRVPTSDTLFLFAILAVLSICIERVIAIVINKIMTGKAAYKV